MNSVPEQQQQKRLLVGPGIVLVASLVGLWLCTELTSLKFVLEFQHCLAPKTGCTSIGGMECSYALTSSASTIFGLPLTVFGFGFYTLTAILSVGLMISAKAFFGLGRISLFVLACCNLVACMFLGAYAVVLLSEMCALCAGLYAVSGVMLIATVALIERPWTESSRRRIGELGRRAARALDGIFILLYVFVAVTGGYAFSYQYAAMHADPVEGCPVFGESIPAPPPATVRIGAENPDLLILAFVDPTCGFCRGEFARLEALAKNGIGPYRVQVHFYQFPRDGGGKCAPAGLVVGNEDAELHRACWASLGVECVEELRRGEGAGMLMDLFGYQDRPDHFTMAQIKALAEGHDLEADDMLEDVNPVVRCIEENLVVRQHIQESMLYLSKIDAERSPKKLTLPYLIVVPVSEDGVPDYERTFLFEGKDKIVLEWLVEVPPRARAAKKMWEARPTP